MVIAADYPFLNILWTMIIFFAWVVWIWMMVVILTDVFRRRDIGGWSKAAWVVFMIILPFPFRKSILSWAHATIFWDAGLPCTVFCCGLPRRQSQLFNRLR